MAAVRRSSIPPPPLTEPKRSPFIVLVALLFVRAATTS
jgi:hypothetical protein